MFGKMRFIGCRKCFKFCGNGEWLKLNLVNIYILLCFYFYNVFYSFVGLIIVMIIYNVFIMIFVGIKGFYICIIVKIK